jgi:hypothetical protein
MPIKVFGSGGGKKAISKDIAKCVSTVLTSYEMRRPLKHWGQQHSSGF